MNEYKVNPFVYIIKRIYFINKQIGYAFSHMPIFLEKEGHYTSVRKKAITDIFRLIKDPYYICYATGSINDCRYLGEGIFMTYVGGLFTKDPVVRISGYGDIDSYEFDYITSIGIHIISKKFYNLKDHNRSTLENSFYETTMTKERWNIIIDSIDKHKDAFWNADHCNNDNIVVSYMDYALSGNYITGEYRLFNE